MCALSFSTFSTSASRSLHVAVQCFQHLGSFDRCRLDPYGVSSRILAAREIAFSGRAKIVRHKCQILFTAPLHFERLLSGKCLDGQSDRLVEDAVQDVESLALQAEAMTFGEIVDAAAKDVVLCDDFDDVEAVLVPLKTVDRRTAFQTALPGSFGQTLTGMR